MARGGVGCAGLMGGRMGGVNGSGGCGVVRYLLRETLFLDWACFSVLHLVGIACVCEV